MVSVHIVYPSHLLSPIFFFLYTHTLYIFLLYIQNKKGFDLSRRKVVQYVDFVNNKEEVNGHGTHVAGTIAGRKSEDGITNEDGFVDGMAPDAKLCFFDIGRDDGSGMFLSLLVSLFFPSSLPHLPNGFFISLSYFLLWSFWDHSQNKHTLPKFLSYIYYL